MNQINFKKLICLTVFFIVLDFCSLSYSGQWYGFQKDAQHTGDSRANFSGDLKPLWEYKPAEHVWRYKKGYSVWSSSVSIADVKGRPMIFAGYYNNNLYAIDAESGSLIWRFIAGDAFNSSPCFGIVNNKPMVYAVSSDRIIYALDAETGKRIWSYETEPWNYTASEAITSSPLIVSMGGKSILICCVWNSNHSVLGGFQKGEIFALDAADGSVIYRKKLSSTPLNSPAFAYIKDKPVLFVSSFDGNIFALDAKDAGEIWKITACAEVRSSPSIYEKKGNALLFFGSRFGNLYCLDAASGKIIWTRKVGHAIDSTPAITNIGSRTFVYIGAYDRNIYAFDAESGDEMWKFTTGDYVVSSCVVASISGKKVIFEHSLDNKIYCLDALTGKLIWSKELGKLIWKYNTRGDTIWSSPAIADIKDDSVLVFPCYDGAIYAFSSK